MTSPSSPLPHRQHATPSAVTLRMLAGACFWLSFLPVLVGAITIPMAPMQIAHYRKGIHTAGTDSYHADMQRALVSAVGNTIVRSVGIVLLVGFASITIRPVRPLQLAVFLGTLATTAVHLALPIVRAGGFMIMTWAHPFYFLPFACAILSGVAVRLLFRKDCSGR